MCVYIYIHLCMYKMYVCICAYIICVCTIYVYELSICVIYYIYMCVCMLYIHIYFMLSDHHSAKWPPSSRIMWSVGFLLSLVSCRNLPLQVWRACLNYSECTRANYSRNRAGEAKCASVRRFHSKIVHWEAYQEPHSHIWLPVAYCLMSLAGRNTYVLQVSLWTWLSTMVVSDSGHALECWPSSYME